MEYYLLMLLLGVGMLFLLRAYIRSVISEAIQDHSPAKQKPPWETCINMVNKAHVDASERAQAATDKSIDGLLAILVDKGPEQSTIARGSFRQLEERIHPDPRQPIIHEPVRLNGTHDYVESDGRKLKNYLDKDDLDKHGFMP